VVVWTILSIREVSILEVEDVDEELVEVEVDVDVEAESVEVPVELVSGNLKFGSCSI